MKFLSCIDVQIEDCSNTIVDIQQPCRCCKTIDMHAVDYPCNIDIENTSTNKCSISDASGTMTVNLQQTSNTVITMEWVCGVGFSERYLCGSDSELITIDGNYLVVKYKPEK